MCSSDLGGSSWIDRLDGGETEGAPGAAAANTDDPDWGDDAGAGGPGGVDGTPGRVVVRVE